MNKSLLAACIVAAVLAAPRAGSAQSPIVGSWAFTVNSPEGTFDIPLTITREDDQLVARLPTGEDFFTGTETSFGVEFFWPLVYQGMDLPTTLAGSFEDGTWSGTADFGGMASGTWEARQAAPASNAWPSANDFAEPGPFAIERERNVGPDAAYDIVRPLQLGEAGRRHPIISWNNGTLYQIDRYQHLLDHWASHGFVVIGAHTNRTRGGAVHKAAIDWLVTESERTGSTYHDVLDLTKIGAAGHSQGGGATITAGANIPGPTGIVTSMPLMPISAFEPSHLAQHTASMLLVSASDDERANRVADQAFTDVSTEFVDAQFVGVHEDAMNPGIQGATLAWFRYQLMGDEVAKAQFYPPGSCGLCGDNAWAGLRHNNSPE